MHMGEVGQVKSGPVEKLEGSVRMVPVTLEKGI